MVAFRSLSTVIIFALLAFCRATPAWANPELVFSLPAASSILPAAPSEIVLTFNGIVKPVRFKVADTRGRVLSEIGLDEPEAQTFHVPIAGQLGEGKYSAAYWVIGDDGQVMVGEVNFSVRPLKSKTRPG